MVDVKDAEACEDQHDEEGDDFESNLALLLRRQHFIDGLLAWGIAVNEMGFVEGGSLRRFDLAGDVDRLGGYALDQFSVSSCVLRQLHLCFCGCDAGCFVANVGDLDSGAIVSVVVVLVVWLSMVVLGRSLEPHKVVCQVKVHVHVGEHLTVLKACVREELADLILILQCLLELLK